MVALLVGDILVSGRLEFFDKKLPKLYDFSNYGTTGALHEKVRLNLTDMPKITNFYTVYQ